LPDHENSLVARALVRRDVGSEANAIALTGEGRSPDYDSAAVRLPRHHGRVQEWLTAAIGVGGTLAGTGLGAGLGYRGALSINSRQRADAQRARVRAALAEYIGALYVAVGEMRDLPPATEPNWLGRALDRLRGEQGA
jgi:hypothetical protein